MVAPVESSAAIASSLQANDGAGAVDICAFEVVLMVMSTPTSTPTPQRSDRSREPGFIVRSPFASGIASRLSVGVSNSADNFILVGGAMAVVNGAPRV